MMMTLLRAHNWPPTVLILAMIALIGFISRSTLVSLPLLQEQVPVRLLIVVVIPSVTIVPLYATFVEFAPALLREPAIRTIRVIATVTLAFAVTLPIFAGTDSIEEAAEVAFEWRLFTFLVSLGTCAVVALGEYAWQPVLSVGLLALFTTAGPGSRVERAVAAVPAQVLVAVLFVAILAFSAFGAREVRRPRQSRVLHHS